MTRFEFPPGSGRTASYSPAEVDLLRPLWDEALRHPPGHAVRRELAAALRLTHELKVELGATVIERPALEPANTVR